VFIFYSRLMICFVMMVILQILCMFWLFVYQPVDHHIHRFDHLINIQPTRVNICHFCRISTIILSAAGGAGAGHDDLFITQYLWLLFYFFKLVLFVVILFNIIVTSGCGGNLVNWDCRNWLGLWTWIVYWDCYLVLGDWYERAIEVGAVCVGALLPV